MFFIPPICINLMIFTLFGIKLTKVYLVHYHQNIPILLNVITKITILTFCSFLVTTLHMISTILYIKYQTNSIKLLDGYLTLFDLFGNFICVILCFKSHKFIYDTSCKCLDKICKNIWYKCIGICFKNTLNAQEKNKTMENNINGNNDTKEQNDGIRTQTV